MDAGRGGTFGGTPDPTPVLVGTVAFASGARATVLFSFDVHRTHLPRIEVYGTTGSLRLPDPNRYDGAVELAADGERELPAVAGLGVRRGSGAGVVRAA